MIGESTLLCIACTGTSLFPTGSRCKLSAGGSGRRACIESGTSSGVVGLTISCLGAGARKLFEGGLLGLSNFSRTESRFFSVSSSDGRDWPKPCEVATFSIDLKYYKVSALVIVP